MAADDVTGAASGYAVLARKYRPQDFDSLIGQEALVRVLTNAFERDRIPHAILLTGVRGVGKTTTARIVAKGLNCTEAEGPTVKPCGRCDNCRAIADSRHVDVMEMDAASRTGIDDIREIIESVRYRANMGRYKVYIIDETHMLSKSAFNGLLKTLEEPPPHVKFILATTDAHKLPATVLSRCMRFDLRRVPQERMVAHLGALCEAESVTAEPAALALVARASEGSVRDALSLLDQAIAHGAGVVEDAAVRDMLGLSETGRAFELFEAILTGAVGEALERLNALYRDGGDPAAILQEVAAACHAASVAKAAPDTALDVSLSPSESAMSRALAEKTSMRALTRCWQMLLKALEEVSTAPSPLAAAEMAVIRMTYVSELPSPEQALRRLSAGGASSAGVGVPAGGAGAGAGAGPSGGPGGGPSSGAAVGGPGERVAAPTGSDAIRAERAGPPGAPIALAAGAARPASQGAPQEISPPRTAERPRLVAEASPPPPPSPPPSRSPSPPTPPGPPARAAAQDAPAAKDGPQSFEEIVALIRSKRDAKLLVEVERFVRPGPVGASRFEFTPAPDAPASLASTLAERLRRWTGLRWIVSIAEGHDGPTLAERDAAERARRRAAALEHPLVRAALAAFPGAELIDVRDAGAGEAEAAELESLLETEGPGPMDQDYGQGSGGQGSGGQGSGGQGWGGQGWGDGDWAPLGAEGMEEDEDAFGGLRAGDRVPEEAWEDPPPGESQD